MAKKKWSIGLRKYYWKFITIEANTEREAKGIAIGIAGKERLPREVAGYCDYNNGVEIASCIEGASEEKTRSKIT